MKGDDFRLVVEAINVAVKHAEERLLTEVNRAVEYHRKAMWVRDEWCCHPMQKFAAKVWCVSKPKQDDGVFGVNYQLRGESVNYCPFCGVFVGREDNK